MLAHLRSQVVKIDMCVKIKGIFTVFAAVCLFVSKIDKKVGGFSSKLGVEKSYYFALVMVQSIVMIVSVCRTLCLSSHYGRPVE